MAAKVIEVIYSTDKHARDDGERPFRTLTTLYSIEGEVLVEIDPWGDGMDGPSVKTDLNAIERAANEFGVEDE